MTQKQWEVHAAYGGLQADDLATIMSDRKLNPYTQAELLAAALAMAHKETGRTHYRNMICDDRGRSEYSRRQITEGLDWLERLGLEPSPEDGLDQMPCFSFALRFRFKLARPYLSKDDDAFYIIDNPVRKEKLLKLPMVSPTTWKGALRAAATLGLLSAFEQHLPAECPTAEEERDRLLEPLWAERAQRVLLFGNEKRAQDEFLNRWLVPHFFEGPPDEEDSARRKWLDRPARTLSLSFTEYLQEQGYRTEKIEGRQGRLFFFPTFFDRIGLEVINPHDRARRVGKQPIYFECAPAGAVGTFRLLYNPYDLSSQVTPDEKALCEQARRDLLLVVETVEALFTVYGFGAKTSSGFGAAHTEFPPRMDPSTGELQKGGLLRLKAAERSHGFLLPGFASLRRSAGRIVERLGGGA